MASLGPADLRHLWNRRSARYRELRQLQAGGAVLDPEDLAWLEEVDRRVRRFIALRQERAAARRSLLRRADR